MVIFCLRVLGRLGIDDILCEKLLSSVLSVL